MNPSSSTIKSNKNYSKHSSTLKLSSSASSPKKPPSQYQFTPTQVLINQILKVLKLRLIIENIKIPDEKIIKINDIYFLSKKRICNFLMISQ